LPQFVGLPRGLREELKTLLSEHGVTLEIKDERTQGEPTARTNRTKAAALFAVPTPVAADEKFGRYCGFRNANAPVVCRP
jgi:hypothetical protein